MCGSWRKVWAGSRVLVVALADFSGPEGLQRVSTGLCVASLGWGPRFYITVQLPPAAATSTEQPLGTEAAEPLVPQARCLCCPHHPRLC